MVSGVNYSIPAYRPNADDIEEWIERLKDFIIALHGSDCPAPRKLAILKTVIGDEANTAIRNFQPGEKDTYDHLTAKLIAYYTPVLQTSTYRHQFYNQYQEEGESVEDFINRLLELASKCGFRVLCRPAQNNDPAVYHDLTNEFVRDRLMVGLTDQSTRVRLMREKNITLEAAADLAKAAEAAKKQLMQTAREKSVHGVHTRKQGPQAQAQTQNQKSHKPDMKQRYRSQNDYKQGQRSSDKFETQPCRYCGSKHDKKNCPAYGKTCKVCGKKNHFAKVCKSKKNIHNIENNDSYYEQPVYYFQPEEDLQIGQIERFQPDLSRVEQSYCKLECDIDGLNRDLDLKESNLEIDMCNRDWYECLKLNDKVFHTVKIDSGAQANVGNC